MKPTDDWSLAMLGNNWPENASIASLEATVDAYRAAHPVAVERVSVLESSRAAVAVSMVGEAFEAMHERMTKLVNDRQSIADGIAKFVQIGDRLIELCYETQKELAAECRKRVEQAREYSDAGLEPQACAELAEGVLMCKEIALSAAGFAGKLGDEMTAAMPVVTPASWGAPATPPGGASPKSDDPNIQATGFGSLKESGGQDVGHGQAGEKTDATPSENNSRDSSADTDKADNQQGAGQGKGAQHGAADSDKTDGTNSSDRANTGHGAASSGRQDPPAPHTSASPAAGISSLPSPASAGGGSALGSPGSSLGSMSSLGMGGMKPPGLEGAGAPGGLGAPRPPMLSPPTGAGAGSGGAGSGAGSGGGIPRIPPTPSVPVTPVSTAPPVSPTPSAAASTSAGAFSANPAAVQPISPAPSGGGATASPVGGGAGPVGVTPVGGAPPAPPPPAQIGAAPTASPGLSQGPLGPASSAAAAAGGVSGSAAGMGVAPATFTEDGPAKVNAHAQLAADTVKSLIPGIAGYPGLAVAAAVVKAPGGIPQVVIATNEGAGYLPEGCFLPPGVIHAFVDLDSLEFDLKWLGWADPARTLIDYVDTYRDRGEPMDLLGLACSVAVSNEVKSLFPQVIPKVAPAPGGKPLSRDGRNQHRLQVLARPFYDHLLRLPEDRKERAAQRATMAAMEQKVAAPLTAKGGPWYLLTELNTDLTDEQWSLFREDYEQRARIVGTMRPGFLADGRSEQLTARYREAYQQLRAMETLLGWQNTAEASVEDIIYAAHQTGIDINPLLRDQN
ncbi:MULTISPECIES: hypothetical protein [Mycobacterium]|nr:MULTISPECIES: hypothetical protein [Mycobacterium]QBZ39406.2 hypothetical protein KV38_26580 [Mycobacterium avium subsp. hominissuis]